MLILRTLYFLLVPSFPIYPLNISPFILQIIFQKATSHLKPPARAVLQWPPSQIQVATKRKQGPRQLISKEKSLGGRTGYSIPDYSEVRILVISLFISSCFPVFCLSFFWVSGEGIYNFISTLFLLPLCPEHCASFTVVCATEPHGNLPSFLTSLPHWTPFSLWLRKKEERDRVDSLTFRKASPTPIFLYSQASPQQPTPHVKNNS